MTVTKEGPKGDLVLEAAGTLEELGGLGRSWQGLGLEEVGRAFEGHFYPFLSKSTKMKRFRYFQQNETEYDQFTTIFIRD